MGYTRADYYEAIIQRRIRSGRASNKSEVVHQDNASEGPRWVLSLPARLRRVD
jgi:hypothetical protein